MAKKTVSDLSKSGQVNSFTGGINTDLHPMLQPNDTLTDCLNGTLITYNGNENMLQNDMGNYELKNAKLPAGYIPMGMKEYQGILYLVLMNPITKHVQIGSYPSPTTDFGAASDAEEYVIQPVEVGTVDTLKEFAKTWYRNNYSVHEWKDSDGTTINYDDDSKIGEYVNNNMHEIIWRLIDSPDNEVYSPYKTKLLRSKLDESFSSTVFTKNFEKNSMLTLGDNYLLSKNYDENNNIQEEYEKNPPFQSLKFFTLNEEKEKSEVDENDLYFDENTDAEESTFKSVAWESNGWLGAQYEVEEMSSIDQKTSGTIYTNTATNTITSIRKDWDLDNKKYTYRLSLGGLNPEGKILDLKEYVNNNKNLLAVLEGDVPTINKVTKGQTIEYKLDLMGGDAATTYYYTPIDFDVDKIAGYMFQSNDQFGRRNIIVCNDFIHGRKIKETLKNANLDADDDVFLILDDADFAKLSDEDPHYIILYKTAAVKNFDKDNFGFGIIAYCEEVHQEFKNMSNIDVDFIALNKDVVETVLEPLVANTNSNKYRIILYSSIKLEKIGIHGTFVNKKYTATDEDSLKALRLFIKSFATENHHIILPSSIMPDFDWLGTYISTNSRPVDGKYYDPDRFYFNDEIQEYQFTSVNLLTYWMYYGLSKSTTCLEKENSGTILSVCCEYDASMDDNFQKAFVETNEGLKQELNPADTASYVFLFSPLDVELYFSVWDQLTFSKSIFSLSTRNLYFPQNDNKYVVPKDFTGIISGGTPILEYGSPSEKNWNNDFGVYEKFTDDLLVPAIVNLNIDNPSRMLITTKCLIDNNIYYKNTSSGNGSFEYTTNPRFPAKVEVESVPYKMYNDWLLIYDDLKSSDVFSYSNDTVRNVVEYTYHVSNNCIYIQISTNQIMDINQVVSDSISVYKESNDVLIPIPTPIDISYFENMNKLDYSDTIYVKLDLDDSSVLNDNKFLFIKVWLSSNNSIILPLFTGMTEQKKTEFINKNIVDFTKLCIDDLVGGDVVNMPTGIVEEQEDTSKIKYLTVAKTGDEKTIIHESDLEYYWYNGIDILKNSVGDDNVPKTYYFGKGTRAKFRVNLTKLGIKEGDVISITGIENKNYEGLTVTVKNHELFEKVGNVIYFKVDALSTYNLQAHTITPTGEGQSEIYRRRYLIHHTTPPVTHSEADLGWVDKPIGKHAGWEGARGLEAKQLYVTKSDACNPNVQLSLISATPGSFDEKNEKFKRGSTLTNKSQVNAVIKEMVGDETTKQLFSLVRAELDTDAGGFTFPMPTMYKGLHKLEWIKNKKNKGCSNALVLTRESDGNAWLNQMKDAIAYTGIVGGIAAVGTMVVMGCVAAFGAAATSTATVATLAAASAAIPFVGWALAAAAILAASIYLLTKLTAGKDQKFEFFAMKGPDKQPLVIPMWGIHKSYKNKNNRPWFADNSLEGEHPWYFDPKFKHAEELITFIATHVYYLEKVGNASISKNDEVPLSKTNFRLTIKIASSTTSSYGLDRYNNILDKIYPSNNFSIANSGSERTFTYTGSAGQNLDNDFDVLEQGVYDDQPSGQCYFYDNLVGTMHPRIDSVDQNQWDNIFEDINTELAKFVGNLGGRGSDVCYDGPIREQDQGAFGGNGGGRRCKFKCFCKKTPWSAPQFGKMMDGDYPLNNQGYVPVAYAVYSNSTDPVMVKDLGWGKANSYWGESKTRYRFGSGENDTSTSSKYYDFIQWDSYSNAFKLTCNTNEIQDKA